MKVMKFGGTSVGSASRMQHVAELVSSAGRNLVVLSAMSGTTNTLVEIAGYLYNHNSEGARDTISRLEGKYLKVIKELYSTEEYAAKARDFVHEIFAFLGTFSKQLFGPVQEKMILAQGELLSTHLMLWYMQEKGINAVLLPALDFMRTDIQGEPDGDFIREHLTQLIDANPEAQLFLTQGFICRNAHDEVDNLQRGGSDYTASLVGAALQAEEIQIWTDIDGMHNNDPRMVANTKPVRQLNFDEAAELAYFGAKILHPTCITPARMYNIPVRLLNTMDPKAPGTLVSNETELNKIKAIAAKDGITSIRIKSSRMLLAYGFLRQVFEIFEHYKTAIDLITTSEVGVSLTIDRDKHLEEIVTDLKKFGAVSVDKDMVIICVVGDMRWDNLGFESKVVDALRDVPVRMISYGGSNYNISVLVRKEDKVKALQALSAALF